MSYLVNSKIKQFYHEHDKQITVDGVRALEIKLIELMEKSIKQWNGHSKRINSTIINLFKI